MPNFLFLGAMVFPFAASLAQQTPAVAAQQKPTPTGQAPAAAAQAQTPAAQTPASGAQSLMDADTSVYTLNTSVREVNLDVVVTDAKGNPVHGLTRGDFKVLDQGQPERLRGFAEHSVAETPVEPPFKLPPNTFTNYAPVGNPNASFVILFDSLNSPVEFQQRAYVAATDFLKDLAPGTSVAIFDLHNRMSLVQPFTTDKAVLLSALKDQRTQPRSSPLLGTGNEVLRMQVLNDGMQMLGKYLTGVPGRKNLIWFVVNIPGSFNSRTASIQGGGPPGALAGAEVVTTPDQTASQLALQTALGQPVGGDVTGQNPAGSQNPAQAGQQLPFGGQAAAPAGVNVSSRVNGLETKNPYEALTNLIDDTKSTSDLLTLSKVVVYTVDPRQLMTPSELGANPGYLFEQSAMQDVAEATGGEAFVNRNGIKSIMQEIVAKGSDYYTLSYSPAGIQWDGSFRKLKVETVGPEIQTAALHLEYRPGYYAADRARADAGAANGFASKTETASDQFLLASEVPQDAGMIGLPAALPKGGLQASMTIGQIPPTELILNASLKSAPAELKLTKGAASPEGNYLREKFKHQPFRMYNVLFATDAGGLLLPRSPDGLHHGGVEFVAAVYTEEGEVVNTFKVAISLNLKDETYRALLRNGMGTKHSLAIPVKGKYVVRLGVHDLNSDRVGALEFPLIAVTAGVAGVGQQGTP